MSAVISNPMPILRPMHNDDLAAVLKVERSAYEFPWTEDILRDCMRVGYYCVVCEIKSEIVGHGIMSFGVGECHLLNICIHPDQQSNGFGTYLVNYLLDLAIWKKVRVVFLEVRVSNSRAQKLYTRMGFNEIGVRKNYYPAEGSHEDAIILAKELQAGNK